MKKRDATLKSSVSSILEQNTSYMAYRKAIRDHHPELDAHFYSLPIPYAEAVYRYLHDLDQTPGCGTCNKPLRYVDRTVGYRSYCGSKCAAKSDTVKTKRAITVEGRDDPFNSTKRRRTMLDRYGVEHALQHPDFVIKSVTAHSARDDAQKKASREQLVLTMKERYGVTNIWDIPEMRNRIKQTNRTKYGVDWAQQNDTVLSKRVNTIRDQNYDNLKMRFPQAELLSDRSVYRGINFYNGGAAYDWKCRTCGHVYISKISNGEIIPCLRCHPSEGQSRGEGELIAFVRGLGIDPVVRSRIIAPREIDVLIPECALGIEYHGLYWHSADKVGNSYHLEKLIACRASGIRLIQVFETEWRNQRAIVESRLRAALNRSPHRIWARKCSIVELSKAEADAFMMENHLQGSCVSKVRYGLVYDGLLVSVMTLGKSRFDKKVEWELLRFANRLNTSVPGGASRLLAHFDRLNASPPVLSYSDRRWNEGSLYPRLGFQHQHSSVPNYWYFRSDRLFHRTHFQKHKLQDRLEGFDPLLTEAVNMRNHGFKRIYDCGMDVFIRP